MNKTDMIDYLVANSKGELNKKQATIAVELHLDAIEDTLKAGDKVQLVGYYTIEPVARAARKGHNPQTGEDLEIAPKMSVSTKAGKKLKAAVEPLDITKYIKEKKEDE
ncbi:hypothetical protein M3_0058 [Lysinibacillus phage vB_LfM_LysYB1]|nr:hypothetical protein M3_0058 [Lysinibacillus phage vB_LfM_LysYB1]WAB25199.1 hypothetical protein M5_0021 [Lysinibacillus phage vB_LfM_LysYB2]